MNNENRPLTVITGDLMMFKMNAAGWNHVQGRDTRLNAISVTRNKMVSGGAGVYVERIAEFSDAVAVFFDDEVTLVQPDNDN